MICSMEGSLRSGSHPVVRDPYHPAAGYWFSRTKEEGVMRKHEEGIN